MVSYLIMIDVTNYFVDRVFMGSKSENLYTCWIPFCDIDVEMGSLVVLPQSHSNKTFEEIRKTYGQSRVQSDGTYSGWLKGIFYS